MDSHHFLSVLAFSTVAMTVSSQADTAAIVSSGGKPASSLNLKNNLRGSRYLQGTAIPMLAMTARINKCEGDCDYDDDCLEGLVCWEGDGSGKAPGCLGTPQVDWDYCVDPNATHFVEPDNNGPLLTEKPKMNVCEGDCDYDEDCSEGLVCWHEQDGSGMVPGCSGTPHTDYEYCIDPIAIQPKEFTERGRLNVCEGDCDYDDDCKDGLVCWYDDGSGEVPGCSGTPLTTWEYCIDPTTLPLQNVTQSDAQLAIVAADSVEPDSDARPSLSERGGLNRCEGDCDYDSDCSDGLICWYGDGSGTIPGCSGTPQEDWEYCVFPTVPMPPRNVTHSETLVDFADNLGPGAYGRCQGDCDYDIDCEGYLVCFDPDDVIGIVPGCEGSPTTSWEYCTDLESIKDYARHRAKIALLNPISTENTTSNTP